MSEQYKYHRRIVCAANREAGTDLHITGPRHWDGTMTAQFHMVKGHCEETLNRIPKFKEQGFIDQHGEFLNRQEAWKVAEAAGQIIRRVGGDEANGGTLYSENLY